VNREQRFSTATGLLEKSPVAYPPSTYDVFRENKWWADEIRITISTTTSLQNLLNKKIVVIKYLKILPQRRFVIESKGATHDL